MQNTILKLYFCVHILDIFNAPEQSAFAVKNFLNIY